MQSHFFLLVIGRQNLAMVSLDKSRFSQNLPGNLGRAKFRFALATELFVLYDDKEIILYLSEIHFHSKT